MDLNSMHTPPAITDVSEAQGFAIVPDVITDGECDKLISLLGPVTGAGRRGLLVGARGLACPLRSTARTRPPTHGGRELGGEGGGGGGEPG